MKLTLFSAACYDFRQMVKAFTELAPKRTNNWWWRGMLLHVREDMA
jgi:hypothetical protein